MMVKYNLTATKPAKKAMQ